MKQLSLLPCRGRHSLPYTLGAIPPPLPRQYLMGYSFQTWPQPDKTAPILSGSSSGFTFLLRQSGFDLWFLFSVSICVRLYSALSLIGLLAAGLCRSALLHMVRCHILCYGVRDPSNKRLKLVQYQICARLLHRRGFSHLLLGLLESLDRSWWHSVVQGLLMQETALFPPYNMPLELQLLKLDLLSPWPSVPSCSLRSGSQKQYPTSLGAAELPWCRMEMNLGLWPAPPARGIASPILSPFPDVRLLDPVHLGSSRVGWTRGTAVGVPRL